MSESPYFYMRHMFDDQLEKAKVNGLDPMFQYAGMTRFIHDCLSWFEAQPELQSIKLKAVALLETEGAHKACIRHHFVLTADGGSVPATEPYVVEALPWNLLGTGVFELQRSHKLVQSYLALSASSNNFDTSRLNEYIGLVTALAIYAHTSFMPFDIRHDVGLSTSE